MPKKAPRPEAGNAIEGYLAPPEPEVVDTPPPIDLAAIPEATP